MGFPHSSVQSCLEKSLWSRSLLQKRGLGCRAACFLVDPWKVQGRGSFAHTVMDLDFEPQLQVLAIFTFIMSVCHSELRHKMECEIDNELDK